MGALFLHIIKKKCIIIVKKLKSLPFHQKNMYPNNIYISEKGRLSSIQNRKQKMYNFFN